MDVKGKSIIVTGASAGIGAELAVELARNGAKVTLASRNAAELERVAARCKDTGAHAGGEAHVVVTDVTDSVSCRALCDAAARKFGGIDVLVNNAGISMWARVDEVTDLSVYERIMKVNYLGAVYCTHFALPYVRERKGLIVAISSLTGITGVPTRSGYAASKHAMQGFFDSLRIEMRHTGVDVLVVSPGFVATGIRERMLGPDGQPLNESKRDESRGTMSTEECVALIVDAIRSRKREVVMTARAKVGQYARLVAPRLVDEVAARAVHDRGGR